MTLWHDLSVRYKLIGLVLLPIILVAALAFNQVHGLQNQVQDLEKIKSASQFIDHLSSSIVADKELLTKQDALQQLDNSHAIQIPLLPNLFPLDDQLAERMAEMQEAVEFLYESEDAYDQYDAIESQADIVEELLTKIETLQLNAAPQDIQDDLGALVRIEWLMLWGLKENALSHLLYNSYLQEAEFDSEIADEIQALSQNQLLYLERFIALNADEQQVSLMLEVFGNQVFSQGREFMQTLLEEEQIAEVAFEQAQVGFSVLEQRRVLLEGVADNIESQLRSEVDQKATAAKNQITGFTLTLIVISLAVVIVTVRFSRHVTNNLKLVLEYLIDERTPDGLALSSHIKGKDELNTFANEVERLTVERKHAQEKLKHAIEVAEKAKDDAIMASKAKSSFLANMSHEIRTPLNGVIGISEVLSDTQLTATQREYVDTIETSSHLLLTLINDILDFSKIESGMLIVSPHASSLRETVYDLASIVMPKVKEKEIGLNINISNDMPYSLIIDDHRLSQVLMNFLSNAVKFTSEGTVELSAQCLELTDNNAKIEFAVQDSGIGIDAEQQRKIFEPFSQEDSSTTRQFGGTGLGLAISTQLVELMGGKIALHSEKGVGSRFSFVLEVPLDKQDYTPKHAIKAPIVLVGEPSAALESLLHEMQVYKLPIKQTVSSISQLESDLAKALVVYLESSASQANDLVDAFTQLEGNNNRICLVQHFASQNFDYKSSISALVTNPVFGLRLVKAIENCDKAMTQSVAKEDSQFEVKQRLLIVEDNKVNQKIASLHVSRLGFDFDIANDGQEAVDIISGGARYNLILMDCMMPIKDGFEAVIEIRQWEKDTNTRKTPIIALTASVVDDDVQRCFDVGMDGYVQKPFKGNQLKEKIFDHIDSSVSPQGVATTSENLASESTSKAVDDKRPQATTKTPDSHNVSAQPNVPLEDKKERVMLVEDNKVNQMVTSLFLEKAGYQYEIANNGQEAINTYLSGNFDIILMDCMMPIKDGYEATKEIRAYEQQEGLNRTPIIALTASVIDDDIQKCYDSGMDAYVPKPIKKEKLLQQMQSIV
ncbi:response regulator [Vibrio sp. WXL103]|uniref:response regulator n=1 Tax=Vibrio sp. WXL103 TaxID=3450710 RepID=UPI003EC4F250